MLEQTGSTDQQLFDGPAGSTAIADEFGFGLQ